MNKPGGVIASSVIAIIGSLLTLLFGISMVVNWAVLRSNPDVFTQTGNMPMPMSPSAFTVVMLIEAIVFLGLSVVGIVCSIGLLRLKNWARVSFLIFGGLLGFFGLVGVFGSAVALVAMPSFLPPQSQVSPGLIRGVMVVLLVFELILGALGIFWLVYFSRRRVKATFVGEAEANVARRGPLSMTIIAWILVVGGALSLLYVPFSVPAVVFGIVLRGWAARIVFAFFAAVSLAAGVGILRWRPKAHSLALGLYVVGLFNALSLLIPGSMERMLVAVQEFLPRTPVQQAVSMEPFLWIGFLSGFLGSCVFLWFLVTRRRAFLEACENRPHAMPPLSTSSQ